MSQTQIIKSYWEPYPIKPIVLGNIENPKTYHQIDDHHPSDIGGVIYTTTDGIIIGYTNNEGKEVKPIPEEVINWVKEKYKDIK